MRIKKNNSVHYTHTPRLAKLLICEVGRQAMKAGDSEGPSRRHGFNLVDIMIDFSIIGLIAAFAVPSFLAARTCSRATRLAGDLRVAEHGFNRSPTASHSHTPLHLYCNQPSKLAPTSRSSAATSGANTSRNRSLTGRLSSDRSTGRDTAV